MKHLKKGKKFHRKTGQRKALLKGLAGNLILRDRIKTTLEKAKETKIKVEKLITVAKKQNLSALRKVKEDLSEKAANKLYYEIAPLYKDRKGGYTRIIKTSIKKIRDASPLAILEFVKEEKIVNKESKE
jgi:large subunit ribosomal protein L17